MNGGLKFKSNLGEKKNPALHLCLCGLEKPIDFTFSVQCVCAAGAFVVVGFFFFPFINPKRNLSDAEREALQLFATFVRHDEVSEGLGCSVEDPSVAPGRLVSSLLRTRTALDGRLKLLSLFRIPV